MGIKLKKLIEEEKPSIRAFQGKIVAIDAPNIIFHLFNFSYRQNGSGQKVMTDRTQRTISHLYGLLYRVQYLYQKKIFPLFCFDGVESELKRRYAVSRERFLSLKAQYRRSLEKENLQKAKQIALGREFFWKNTVEESKQLLKAMGVPVIISPSSAEAQCAELVKKGVAHYSNSFDYDSLLYGCPRMVKNLNKSRRKKLPEKKVYITTPLKVIDLEKNLTKLRLDRFQLVDMAILIGTDFFEGVPGIGAKTAYNLIKRYKNLVGVVSHTNDKYVYRLNREKIQRLRNLFLFPSVILPNKLQWTPPNERRIYDLLLDNHTLSPKRVENAVEKLYNRFHTCIRFFRRQKTMPSLVQTTLF
jgi:flap endonuclease-1